MLCEGCDAFFGMTTYVVETDWKYHDVPVQSWEFTQLDVLNGTRSSPELKCSFCAWLMTLVRDDEQRRKLQSVLDAMKNTDAAMDGRPTLQYKIPRLVSGDDFEKEPACLYICIRGPFQAYHFPVLLLLQYTGDHPRLAVLDSGLYL